MRSSRLSGTRTVAQAINDGLVSVVFQPIVSVTSGRIFAYEALARSRAKGLENPMRLFEVAAEEELCGALGRQIRELATENVDAPLFLNVHPHELSDRWLVQPDDPIFTHDHDVYLEITESVPLSHFDLVNGVLREVRGKGVGLVVDDLGAGYSNLRYIADLAPEVVKLDRGLVAGLDGDARRGKLVASIVRLCEDLGARVVAEGIETEAELAAVTDAGVHYVQGFLIARPATPPPRPTYVIQNRRTAERASQPLPPRRRPSVGIKPGQELARKQAVLRSGTSSQKIPRSR
ncbi:MAG: EAL domain-containing protein [Polyangiaceae bacterium]